jgi:hypothetical protein
MVTSVEQVPDVPKDQLDRQATLVLAVSHCRSQDLPIGWRGENHLLSEFSEERGPQMGMLVVEKAPGYPDLHAGSTPCTGMIGPYLNIIRLPGTLFQVMRGFG